MTLLKPDGTPYTQAEFNADLTEKTQPSSWTIDTDVIEEYHVPGTKSTKSKRLKFHAGQVLSQKDKDDAYKEPTIPGALSPATGPAAGGTVVTITGTNLTGSTGVTFGGTAGTAFEVVSDTQVKVTTPAKTAGAVAVVLQHPAGNVTKANAFTYA